MSLKQWFNEMKLTQLNIKNDLNSRVSNCQTKTYEIKFTQLK